MILVCEIDMARDVKYSSRSVIPFDCWVLAAGLLGKRATTHMLWCPNPARSSCVYTVGVAVQSFSAI